MNPFLAFFLISLVCYPIGFFSLRIIFGRSFLFRVSFFTITAMYVCCFLSFYAGVKGVWNLLWAAPVMAALTLIIFLKINKIKNNLDQVIHQMQDLSKGLLRNGLHFSGSDDEIGRLNDMLMHMIEIGKKIHSETNTSVGNLVSASLQTLDASEHLSKSSYTQALSIEDVLTEIEHMELKIRNNKEISSTADTSIQDAVKATKTAMETSLQLTEKLNLIHQLVAQNEKADLHEIKELSQSANELNQRMCGILKVSTDRINLMSQMIHEAFCLSEDQSHTMEVISAHIEKLDIMAQQNTVYSVELTACSEMLKEEAEKLKKAISGIHNET
jgi:methyl-accepting chemotaxis protein